MASARDETEMFGLVDVEVKWGLQNGCAVLG